MRITAYVHIDLAAEPPKIIDGYWHEFVDGEWINTGVKAIGVSGVSIGLGTNYYAYKVRSNGSAYAKTLTIPIYAYKDNKRLSIQASQISTSGYVPHGMTVTKATNQITVAVSSLFYPLPDGEGITIHVVIDGETYPLSFNYGVYADGEDGKDGDGIIIRYMRSEDRPNAPQTGNINPPGWMEEIDEPINGDIYWPHFIGDWILQPNGEYKSNPIEHYENTPLRFQFFNRTAGTELKITVRTSSESYDKVFVGKLDEDFGDEYDNARIAFGGTQSQEFTYALPRKGEHYILFDYKKDRSVSSGDDAAYLKIELPIQSIWMTMCTVKNGIAGEWSKPVLFIDERIEETIAELNKTKAITDKFGTTTDGGLIQTVMMYLREVNSQQVTAGVSGIQGINRNHPAFWSGGTHSEAIALIDYLAKISEGVSTHINEYDALAAIVLLHNGAAKIGDFIVDQDGRILIIDPATGLARLVFDAVNLPSLSSLLDDTSDSNSYSLTSGSTMSSIALSNNIDVKHGGSLSVGAVTIGVSGMGYSAPNGMSEFAEARAELWRNGSRFRQLGNSIIHFTSLTGSAEHDTHEVRATVFSGLPEGRYQFRLVVFKSDSRISATGTSTSSTINYAWSKQDVNIQQYGLDGMMFFYSTNHFHYTEQGGLDLRGMTNMPGPLGSTTVAAGGLAYVWGAKLDYSVVISGGYRIHLKNMTHNRYSVLITPHTNTQFRVGVKTSTYFEIFGSGAADVAIFGDNYG